MGLLPVAARTILMIGGKGIGIIHGVIAEQLAELPDPPIIIDEVEPVIMADLVPEVSDRVR